MEGVVVSSTGSHYMVESSEGVHLCKIRGKFRMKGVKTTNPVAVGDKVSFTQEGDCGWITTVHERKNGILRKSVNLSKQTHIIAANIDMAFLVVGLTQPRTPQGFIDRFLSTAEAYRVPASIVVNKTDLFGEEERQELHRIGEIYTPLGYGVLATSTVSGEGMDALRERMRGKICLFSGNSGVGKSALIHRLEPDLDIRVGEISAVHQKGQHTTTHARMYTLSFGAKIVDTPGIKEFGMVQFQKDELSRYFPEMQALISECRFNNCTHEHEPGCAVKKAVEEGRVSPLRYKSYLNILHGDEVPLPGLLENKNDRK